MKNSRIPALLTLLTLALAAPALSHADDSGAGAEHHHHGHWKKFAACVKDAGGTLPELTQAQRKTSHECFKDNKGNKDQAKACLDKAGIPAPDAKTEAAIQACHAKLGGHHKSAS